MEIIRKNIIDENHDPRVDGKTKNVYSLRIIYVKRNNDVDAHIIIEYSIDNIFRYDEVLEKESTYTKSTGNRIQEYIVTYLSYSIKTLKRKETKLALNLKSIIEREYNISLDASKDFKSAIGILDFRLNKLERIIGDD